MVRLETRRVALEASPLAAGGGDFLCIDFYMIPMIGMWTIWGSLQEIGNWLDFEKGH